MRVRWCGNVYLIMWKHVIDNVEMCVRWNGNMYLMTWIHVFDNVEMCVRWCECTYLMTWIYIFDNVRIRARWIGPLHLAECLHPISWVSVGISRNVCWYLEERFVCISLAYVVFSRCIRNVIADRQQHYRNPLAVVGVRFIVPAYTYSQQHWKPFEMLSRNIRNVLIICRLHIQHLKVWVLHSKDALLRCKRRPFVS